jgi:hypothetical protein
MKITIFRLIVKAKMHIANLRSHRLLILSLMPLASLLYPTLSTAMTMHGRYLTFHGNPDTCITITSLWDQVDTIKVLVGTENSLSHPETIVSYSGLRRHHVELNGLQPNTRYYYEIQDKFGNAHTDIDSFKTADVLGSHHPLALLLVSDFQPNADPSGQAERDSIRGMIDTIRTQISQGRCPYPDLILNMGDFISGQTIATWDTIMAILDTLNELAPLLPTMGNHDGFPKGKSDSCGYVYHFNLPPSGFGSSSAGDHQYSLDYQNIRFINLSVCDDRRQRPQDQLVPGSGQYEWLNSTLSNTPPSIDLVIEMHHVNLTPLPWNPQNGAPDSRFMTWQNGIYDNPAATNTAYDTLRYEYYRYIVPLLRSVNAISLEGHAWFSAATTPLASSIYFNNLPIICCAGGNGWSTNKQSFCVMNISTDEIHVDYHKVDTWPDAAVVAAGYPWQEAATQRIFTIYQSPMSLRDTDQDHLALTIQKNLGQAPLLHFGGSLSKSNTGTYDDVQGITLNWTPIVGAFQYYIYRLSDYGQDQWTLIDSTTATTYEDLSPASDQARSFYRITANPDGGLAELHW